MKKIALVFAGLLASGSAMAKTFDAGQDTYPMTDCVNSDGVSILTEDVTITLSSGVAGAVECGTGTDGALRLAISTCHTAGRTSLRTVEDPDDSSATIQLSGAAFPTASTAQGTVKSEYQDGASCDTTTASAFAAAKAAE